MSKASIVDFTCPACGAVFQMKRWESYNASLEEMPMERILHGDLFRYTCPQCKKEHKIVYPCLYHDMDQNFMIYFQPGSRQRQFFAKAFDSFPEYVLRLETDLNSFLERIFILNHGLNDKLFELCRLFVLNQIHDRLPQATSLYFIGIDHDQFCFQVIADDSVISTVNSSMEPYRALSKYFDRLEVSKQQRAFEKIDVVWVLESHLLESLGELM